MADTIKQLREKRAKAVADAQKITDKAYAAKRELDAAENTAFDAFMAESDGYKAQIDAMAGAEQRAARLATATAELAAPEQRRTRDADPDDEPRARARPGSEGSEPGDYADDNRTEMRYKRACGQARSFRFRGRTATPEYRMAYDHFIRHGFEGMPAESRALLADSAADGGFLVAPQQMAAGILRKMDDSVWMRQLATITDIPTAAGLGVPTLETDPADADWTAEATTVGTDTAMKFGKRELRPTMLSKAVSVSRKLIRMVASVDSFVEGRLGYKFQISMEKGYLTGNGSNQPLGVFTASSNGISTTRDISTGNTSTAITADGLISAKYSLRAGYRMAKTTAWLFHKDALAQIRKLKDSTTNLYLWRVGQGIEGDHGDTILDIPVKESEYCPNTFTTGLYVGLIGDFSYYHIADALQFEVQRLVETKAKQNQIELVGRIESDGMPAFEEAFTRVKLG